MAEEDNRTLKEKLKEEFDKSSLFALSIKLMRIFCYLCISGNFNYKEK